MNYVAYKNIDGTITSGFKVKLYDIVTLNTGYWKDKLAIVLYINEDRKQIKVRIIECGMNLTLKVKDVQFVNHNNIHTKKPSTIFTDNTRQNYKYEII